MAISSDNQYEIVVFYPGDFFAAETAVLRVRSRHGLLSRESTDVGCVRPADSDAAVISVPFTGSHEFTVDAGDGRFWQVGFDPQTLRPTATFDLPCR
ncbi:MAG TPA: hypothetical protein VFC19_03255 [Candidatus Limnocylindrales bacterium]|nr:hypothetical protein [Candidatus Limnocylindrales bacterium]